uniref:Uncharacterized protein n=1 Tax=Rhizophora mucronata TaxID=61149 RepID=A0A2P2QFS6_RHIMU
MHILRILVNIRVLCRNSAFLIWSSGSRDENNLPAKTEGSHS